MNRRRLVRGIQLVVVITVATFAWITWDAASNHWTQVGQAFSSLSYGWLAVAGVLALQEGLWGGLRVYLLGRVVTDKLSLRTAISSEFVLMFCAGVTPGQAGAAPAQVGVLMRGGMGFPEAATVELLIASCTGLFFLVTAVGLSVMWWAGWFVVPGVEGLGVLLGMSMAIVGITLVLLALAASSPPLLKRFFAWSGGKLRRFYVGVLELLRRSNRLRRFAQEQLDRPGRIRGRLIRAVDEFHHGVLLYRRKGKKAYLAALLVTAAFFGSRFAAAYFVLLALHLPVEPETFVAVGPPFVQVVLMQALLNFALYVSPTPSASGIAEMSSTALMSPWVRGGAALPYLLLWRATTQVLCMLVGGIYVFRYLGTDVLEAGVKQAEDAEAALAPVQNEQPQLVVDPPMKRTQSI